MNTSRPLVLLAAALALSGCTHLTPAADATPAAAAAVEPRPEPPARPFPPDVLYDLLLAELAGQNNRADIAIVNYTQQALATNDPNVLARATQIAQYVNAQPLTLELAERWAQHDPDNSDASYALVINALRNQRFDLAIPALNHLLQQEPEADLEHVFLGAIPSEPENRQKLLQALDTLPASDRQNPDILFGRALLLEQDRRYNEALIQIKASLQRRPASVPAILLEARLYTEMQRDPDALQRLADALKTQPDSRPLRLNYARMLVRNQDMPAAEAQFGLLLKQNPEDSEILLTLGLLALENKHYDLAETNLRKLLELGTHNDEANYYLGTLNRRQGRADAALAALEAVEPGPFYLPARTESATLLLEQGKLPAARGVLGKARAHLPEAAPQLYALEAELLLRQKQNPAALALLDEAIKSYPDNEILLYSRAMAAEKQDRLDVFEADMRRLLARNPDNATALNALGYTLADRTDRLPEAAELVGRALSLRPDDPAILDSMGWVLFRQGKYPEALDYLQKAYQQFPDDEVAAHLGEVLWVMGKREEARRVWAESLARTPDSRHVAATQKRLGA